MAVNHLVLFIIKLWGKKVEKKSKKLQTNDTKLTREGENKHSLVGEKIKFKN